MGKILLLIVGGLCIGLGAMSLILSYAAFYSVPGEPLYYWGFQERSILFHMLPKATVEKLALLQANRDIAHIPVVLYADNDNMSRALFADAVENDLIAASYVKSSNTHDEAAFHDSVQYQMNSIGSMQGTTYFYELPVLQSIAGYSSQSFHNADIINSTQVVSVSGIIQYGKVHAVCNQHVPCDEPDAQVKVTFMSMTGKEYSTRTNSEGFYSIYIPTGFYTMKYENSHAKFTTNTWIIIVTDNPVRFNIYFDTGIY